MLSDFAARPLPGQARVIENQGVGLPTMFLACPQCEVHYKLSDLSLGPTGRKVRCTSCGHVWRAFPPPPEELPPTPVPGPFTNTDAIDDEAMSVSFDAEPAADPEPMVHDPAAYDDVGTGEAVPDAAAVDFGDWPTIDTTDAPAGVIPDVVKPVEADAVAGETLPHYQPTGMSANAFGFAIFLLPLLLTAVVLIALRGPLVGALPALAPVYSMAGLAVSAPGEGLRLSTLVAERRIDDDVKVLALTATLANISAVAQDYPPLRATVSGPYGAVLKTWDLPAPADRTIASGEESPIKVEFKDVPDAAAVVSLKVRKP